MTTYPFEYERASSIDEALSLMERDASAKLLAGGHSLVPSMKLRLSRPSRLIDIGGLDELKSIDEVDGRLHVGALATHRTVEQSELVRKRCAALGEAAALIGDPQVRNCGTIGGSLAHADPAADYPALVLALGAQIETVGTSGTRRIEADDYFVGMFETALREGEMITRVLFPVLGSGTGAAYAKFPNPASRYAVVGVAAYLEVDDDGTCTAARIGVTGAASAAFRASRVEEALVGNRLDDVAISGAVADLVDPADLLDDLSASAAYRAHLCRVMARRALTQAAQRLT